jgi:hypothetical protein
VAAARPFDGQIFSLILPYVDAETMSMFLAQVSQEFADDWNLMFLDGAGWHRAKNLRVPAVKRRGNAARGTADKYNPTFSI